MECMYLQLTIFLTTTLPLHICNKIKAPDQHPDLNMDGK